MYMDVGQIDAGYLVAKEFTTGAEVASRHIQKQHKKIIKLTEVTGFPILHLPDDTERQEYY